jgi:citrate lyase subunit beta/citryl-CoA lyase
LKLPITSLFVPGNRPERFDKAFATDAGAIIIDLEDAVVPAEKAGARDAIARWVEANPDAAERIAVRINDSQSEWFGDDLAMIRDAGIQHVMLPKAEWREQVELVRRSVAGAQVLALVETARGIRNVDQIATSEGVSRLAFGTLDYAVDLDLSGDEAGLAYPSARIAIASRCAELPSPIAGVTPSITDEARIRADFAFARGFGFGAKMCIHPKQVELIHAACRPSAEDQAWARRVLAAAESSEGAVQLDGKMIDRPVVLKAQAILARASVGEPH